jgi:fatty acid desaturase
MDPHVDPDAYPTLEHYQRSRRARVADSLSFGGRRLSGVVCLLVGLCGQSAAVLLSSGPRVGYLSRRGHLLALAETGLALAFWLGLAILFGWPMLIFGWLVPVALANVILMAHILTNHGLSALTDENDPLENSLSVTVPGWVDRLTLQFGLHVEHHLFPSVSGRHAPRIREILRARWPGRYRELPILTALGKLFRTGRIYKDRTTLVDPRTGIQAPTL